MSITDTACPVIERIARILFERLERLKDGSYVTKTYNVIRPTRLAGFSPEHLMVIQTQGEEELLGIKPGNPPSVEFRMRFEIKCFVIPSEKDPEPVETYINFATADIRKAVVNADSDWHSFVDADSNTLAINADWESPETFSADGGPDGVTVPLVVHYRVSEHDHYVVR